DVDKSQGEGDAVAAAAERPNAPACAARPRRRSPRGVAALSYPASSVRMEAVIRWRAAVSGSTGVGRVLEPERVEEDALPPHAVSVVSAPSSPAESRLRRRRDAAMSRDVTV
ncbi:hypothetical protein DN069_38525, partial [Streptacidiphilus pinicola]